MPNITYQTEDYSDIKYEIQPLVYKHWEEVALYKDKVTLAPDWSRYETLSQNGALHIVTARDDGDLIGYFVTVVTQGLHYKMTTYGMNDILLILPEYRKSGVGRQLFIEAEKSLKDRGVDVITVNMHTTHPFDSLCEDLGYEYIQRMYSKYIGD